ncbi:hypothetical protein BGZ74_006058, partial [Mortierella antarctica]
MAIMNFYNISDDDVVIEEVYRFCEVHYDRSVRRFGSKGANIPAARKQEFIRLALSLLKITDPDEFDRTIATMLALFPRCKSWVVWYLHPDRGKLIYPALRGSIQPTACKDTNLQECLGGDTKTYIRDSVSHCTIIRGVRAIALYQKSYFDDFEFYSRGGTLRYPISKPSVPTKYVNDGRAPDTEKAIDAAEAKFPAGVNVIGALYSTVVNTVKHPLSMGINTVDSRSPQAG